MTFQISWRVAWQLYQPVPSGLWDASHQVPWTSVRLGSSGGPRTWSSLTTGGILPSWSPSCHPSTQEGWGERLSVKTEAKKLWSTSAFSSSAVSSLWVSLMSGGTLWPSFSSWHTCRSPSCYFSHPLRSSAPAVPWPSWRHPYTTGQLPYTLPRKPVPASTLCSSLFFLSLTSISCALKRASGIR